jgi:hypothetical protein
MPVDFSALVNWGLLILGGAGVGVSIVLQLFRARRRSERPTQLHPQALAREARKLSLVRTSSRPHSGGRAHTGHEDRSPQNEA